MHAAYNVYHIYGPYTHTYMVIYICICHKEVVMKK